MEKFNQIIADAKALVEEAETLEEKFTFAKSRRLRGFMNSIGRNKSAANKELQALDASKRG